MAAYTVLANRFRPRRFEDVVGQEDTARVLSAAIAAGRAGHAFLFSGPRGVGKTSMARILAKAFDCLERDDGVPCGSCRICKAIDEAAPCLDVVEIDGASHNKVENVRDLIENLRFRPVEARYRIYVIDEVHMLSTAAFNALLKTLEEPPAHAKFILATTEPLKVPETIRSRCQVFDFRRLSAGQIADRLALICKAEGVPVPEGLLARLARHANGGLRDALSLLDQLITYGEGRPTLADFERLTGRLSPELLARLVGAALEGDGKGAHAACAEALIKGARPADLVEQLTEVLEGLLVTCAGGEPADRTPEERDALAQLAGALDVDRALAMLDVMVEAGRRLRQRADGRLVAEMAVLNLARIHDLQSLADLLADGAAEAGPAPAQAKPPKLAQRARPVAAPSRRAASSPSGPERAAQGQAAPPSDTEFREALLAALKRSLRTELARSPVLRLDGDDVVLQPTLDVLGGLCDPRRPEVRAALLAAAQKVMQRELGLRLVAPSGAGKEPSSAALATDGVAAGGADTQADSPGAGPTSDARKRKSSPVDRTMRELWPDAEHLDS